MSYLYIVSAVLFILGLKMVGDDFTSSFADAAEATTGASAGSTRMPTKAKEMVKATITTSTITASMNTAFIIMTSMPSVSPAISRFRGTR